jgi:hypothetical protein
LRFSRSRADDKPQAENTIVVAHDSWPLAVTCGFLIFATASSTYLVISSQSTNEMVSRTLKVESKLLGMLSIAQQ